MNNITTFNFNNFPVRIEIKDNEPLFCLTDVATVLNIRNANPSRFNLNEDGIHKMYTVDTLERKNELTFINEPNLYRVIFRSNKQEAVDFQNWVFEEVLPTIRKTGGYGYTTKPTDLLTAEQQKSLRELVVSNAKKLPREEQAGAIVQAWSKLKAHFKVPYRKIPQECFTEALSIVQRHYVDWELVDDTPSTQIAHRVNTLEFDEEEILDIVRVFTMACYMNDTIRFLEKPMRLLGIPRAGMMYSEGFEYQRSLKEALPVFEKILKHFPPEGEKHSPIYGYTKPWDKVHNFFPLAKERLTY